MNELEKQRQLKVKQVIKEIKDFIEIIKSRSSEEDEEVFKREENYHSIAKAECE